MVRELIARLRKRFFSASHKRVCRKCHKPIKRHHRWHQVRVGWIAPWFCCEHWDCDNPLRDPNIPALISGPELPFPKTGDILETLP